MSGNTKFNSGAVFTLPDNSDIQYTVISGSQYKDEEAIYTVEISFNGKKSGRTTMTESYIEDNLKEVE